ncbi:MAG: bifunctional 4-hydroxy-2-oxoglutarate aldolase/2-dehydro-3-deoxy-phosphogluconate aldolase [Burkholderiales bacterium]|nr:bifunctional 4-hydroxy-2-oxoglutarate aldolase/2-dehydro-3-deoxy-phosphogluconate aldolase [Burkholderiales bacterium]
MHKQLTAADLFKQNKVIPVVVINDVDKASAIVTALLEGGINAIEITLRTINALEIINLVAKQFPEMLVGAGTVLSDSDYHKAAGKGAKFIVSPGLSQELANTSHDYDIPFIPGAITPTEIINAYNLGFEYLKLFPAQSFNGIELLKSLSSPLPHIKFCPTGGINMNNIKQYLELPNVAAVGCSFIVSADVIKNSDYQQITKTCKTITSFINS